MTYRYLGCRWCYGFVVGVRGQSVVGDRRIRQSSKLTHRAFQFNRVFHLEWSDYSMALGGMMCGVSFDWCWRRFLDLWGCLDGGCFPRAADGLEVDAAGILDVLKIVSGFDHGFCLCFWGIDASPNPSKVGKFYTRFWFTHRREGDMYWPFRGLYNFSHPVKCLLSFYNRLDFQHAEDVR